MLDNIQRFINTANLYLTNVTRHIKTNRTETCRTSQNGERASKAGIFRLGKERNHQRRKDLPSRKALLQQNRKAEARADTRKVESNSTFLPFFFLLASFFMVFWLAYFMKPSRQFAFEHYFTYQWSLSDIVWLSALIPIAFFMIVGNWFYTQKIKYQAEEIDDNE